MKVIVYIGRGAFLLIPYLLLAALTLVWMALLMIFVFRKPRWDVFGDIWWNFRKTVTI